MSLSNAEREITSVIHWFKSWSDFQKQDFLKNLVEKAVPQKVSTLFDAMTSLNVQDKPPSIFKCQLKLFDQWFCEWSAVGWLPIPLACCGKRGHSIAAADRGPCYRRDRVPHLRRAIRSCLSGASCISESTW